eukprot:Platyproteum_vivax@DN5630_c0_g1_i1.p1
MTELRGLDDYIKKLEAIQGDSGAKPAEKKSLIQQDDFVKLKADMYDQLAMAREWITERRNIQKASGNCYEAIKKNNEINDALAQLDDKWKKLQSIYKKQVTRKKVEAVELENRWEDLEVLKRHIQEARLTHKNAGKLNDVNFQTAAEYRNTLREAGNLPVRRNEGNRGPAEEPSEEDKATVGRWQARDKEFDKDLDEIKEGVEVLEDIALNIGQKADQQSKMIKDVNKDTTKAEDKLVDLNAKVKKVLGANNQNNCMCRVVLIVLIIGCVAFIWNMVTNSWFK